MKSLLLYTDKPENYQDLKDRLNDAGYNLFFEKITPENGIKSPLSYQEPTLIGRTGVGYEGWTNVFHYLTRVLKVDLNPKDGIEAKVN